MNAELDPVKYEIFRHRLFSILEEGRTTISMVSGSPVIVEGGECMLSFYDTDGECILCAAGLLFHTTGCGDAIRKAIEWYQDNPGIYEGDQFFFNDPYIAGSHTYDEIVVKPIFYQGKRVAWSGSMTHTSDTGGSLRGVSTEIFHEGIRFPGIKLVERDELRSDIYRSITEQCRDPDYVGLDLKARIASNNVCDRGYLGLIEKYGVDFIEEASHKLMDDTEKLARKKLRSLPDGTWRARMYASTTIKGEGGKEEVKPYKLVCAMNKEGDEITFDVTGTSPQNADYNNATFFATWSLLFTVVAGHLFWDLPWNAGITAPVKLIAPEGSMLTCRFPAACGLGTMNAGFFGDAAHACVHRMLYAGGRKEDVNAVWRGRGGGGGAHWWYGGHSQSGGVVSQGIYDIFAGGQGASPFSDGDSTGSRPSNARACISDVEFIEMYYPFLYLARRNMKDSGGLGKYAGGMGLERVLMVYGSQDLTVNYIPMPSGFEAGGHGLFGGYPYGTGLGGSLIFQTQNMVERLKQSMTYPTTLDELSQWGVEYSQMEDFSPTRTMGGVRVNIPEWDLQVYQHDSGSGYGDPLDRDPNMVVQDVKDEIISLGTAAKVYGVVIDPKAHELNTIETEKRRREIRDERLREGKKVIETNEMRKKSPSAKTLLRIHEYLEIVEREDGQKVICCIKCGNEFCKAGENYKKHALRWTRPISQVKQTPEVPTPDYAIYFQEYICPGCQTLLQVDTWWPVLDSDEPLWDIQIRI